jgi:hypothetical protein
MKKFTFFYYQYTLWKDLSPLASIPIFRLLDRELHSYSLQFLFAVFQIRIHFMKIRFLAFC